MGTGKPPVVALVLMQVLRQCGDNFSRENILRQAENLFKDRPARSWCRLL